MHSTSQTRVAQVSGTFNPPHRGHLRLGLFGKERLERLGHQVEVWNHGKGMNINVALSENGGYLENYGSKFQMAVFIQELMINQWMEWGTLFSEKPLDMTHQFASGW
jgi:hypothetical protein